MQKPLNLNFEFKLPGSLELYERNKNLFEMKSAKINSGINLNRNFFVDACENPMSAFKPTLSGFILGFIEPFRYKLYLQTICYLTLFFCLISLEYIVFGRSSSFFFNFSFLFLYLFFMCYSKAMWARKVYDILDRQEKTKSLTETDVIKKIKPNSLLFTVTVGLIFVMSILIFNIAFMGWVLK